MRANKCKEYLSGGRSIKMKEFDRYDSDTNQLKFKKLLHEISHELNNSLTSIIGFTQLVMNDGKLDDKLKSHMDTIYEAALDSKYIIDRVKECTSIEYEDKKVKISLSPIAESASNMSEIRRNNVCQTRGINIEVIKDFKAENLVNINPRGIREVILNILLNSIDSIECDGKIHIKTRDHGKGVLLEIKDNGKIMDKETLSQIFNPYFTTKGSEGTGLGMSIAKDIIEKHGGTIDVESSKLKDTIFKIYLE